MIGKAKLIQYWDIQQSRKKEFDSFFTSSFIPWIDENGLMKMTGTWHVASGEGPYFIAEGVAESVEDVENLIMNETYQELRHTLFQFIDNYSSKLLTPTGRVEIQPVQKETTYKFTQHFNINPQDYYEFISFVKNDHLPGIESYNLKMIGGWYVAIGRTPYIVVETRAETLNTIGKMLQSSHYYQLTQKLLTMVSEYGAKILVPSGHIQ